MDSSNSQHSLSQPTNSSSNPSSGSGSASGYSGSDSRTRSGSGGSISPSTENNVPEGDNSSNSMQMECSTTTTPEDMDINMEDSSTSTNPSTGKENVNVETGSSNSRREGKEEEIGLLVDLYNLHSKTGRYALITDGNDQREFYKFWIEEEGDYANMKELDEKINELHERFLKNMDKKNVDGPTDSVDVEIFRLSEWIWGAEIDSCEQETDDGQEEGVKDSSDVNVVDDGANADGSSQPKESWSIAKGKGSAAS